MPKMNFAILSYNQTVSIDVNNITGHRDTLNSYIHIPIHFELGVKDPNEYVFDLLPGQLKLHFAAPKQLLSENSNLRPTSVTRTDANFGYQANFRLGTAELHFLEKYRDGDLRMELEIGINAYIKQSVPNSSGRRQYSNEYIHSDSVTVSFAIPKSVWVEKILPQTGFRNLRLVEIPLSHVNLKEAYKDIVAEFEKAEHYFNLHDYNKCIAHCRHTLDALTRNLKSVKTESKSETGFKWLETVSTETFNWLDHLNKSTNAIASKTHHSGQVIDFKREEAESIYLIVLGMLNYIGHLKR